MRAALLGMSYDTGNLGVSALTEGTLSGILDCEGDAVITILCTSSRQPKQFEFEHNGRRLPVSVVPIRYGKTFWRRDHILPLFLRVLAARCLPASGLRERLFMKSTVLRTLLEADLVADISGGDSFTDIYGLKRTLLQMMFKLFVLAAGRDIVLLPQTVGPFKGVLSRKAAGFVLRRAGAVYVRDKAGICETRLLAKSQLVGRLRYAPDVGVLVEPSRPRDAALLRRIEQLRDSFVLVGVNVSGLLYSGGYTLRDQFKLKADYRRLGVALLSRLLEDPAVFVILVPHVITPRGHVESDIAACEKTAAGLTEDKRRRIFVAESDFSVREVKWVIGQCAFFAGSRMHACIAALSQAVPSVGIAYSRKFKGVFESLGAGGQVADLRTMSTEEIIEMVMDAFARREELRGVLSRSAPAVTARARAVFEDLIADTGRAGA